MKKTIVLMTIVLAILAAPVFAEGVGVSGSVEFDWAWGVDDNYKEDSDGSETITIDGTISDYTSVNAELSADSDDDASLSAISITQDVTGAMGVMSPVTFAYKLGYMSYSPVDYSGVAPYNKGVIDATAGLAHGVDEVKLISAAAGSAVTFNPQNFKTMNMLGAKLMFGLADMVNVDVAVYPTSLQSEKALIKSEFLTAGAVDSTLELGINAYGTFGIVDASVYYVSSVRADKSVKDSDKDPLDEDGNYFGLSLAASPVEGVTVGFGLEFAPDQEYLTVDFTDPAKPALGKADVGYYVADYCLNVGYTAGPLAAGFGFCSTLSDNPATEDWTFAEASDIVLSAKYAVSEAINVFASFDTPLAVDAQDKFDGNDELVDLMDYEVGADVTFDGVTYAFGYTMDNDLGSYDAEFSDKDGKNTGNVFLKVSASF